ncbi:MAG: adenosylcobinamide amidohydrolase [Candidatus Binataceae bacterium]
MIAPRIGAGASYPCRAIIREPWRWRLIARRTLAVELPQPYLVLGWAPLNGGFRRARVMLNHQVALDDRAATEAPRAYLAHLARTLGYQPRDTVAMMTGAEMARLGTAKRARDGLLARAWCSAGCSNALRVGDRATAATPLPGTINLIVALDRSLSTAALAEALQIAVEARVAAMMAAGVTSVRSRRPATGTGTDCVMIAAPASTSGAIQYCGKHTVAGELIGRAAMRGCIRALARRTL